MCRSAPSCYQLSPETWKNCEVVQLIDSGQQVPDTPNYPPPALVALPAMGIYRGQEIHSVSTQDKMCSPTYWALLPPHHQE